MDIVILLPSHELPYGALVCLDASVCVGRLKDFGVDCVEPLDILQYPNSRDSYS